MVLLGMEGTRVCTSAVFSHLQFPYHIALRINHNLSHIKYILTMPSSNNKPQPMVPIRRPSIHSSIRRHGPPHDPRPRLPLLRSRPPQVGTLNDMGLHGLLLHHHNPMVFLGLLSRLQFHRHKRVHRKPQTLRYDDYLRGSKSGQPACAGITVCVLSGR